MPDGYDFSGWATKNDLLCADGRIIRRNAFSVNDGQKVPLVWNHSHNSPAYVLGHAVLENRDDGVYAYCSLNNTENGRNAKEQIQHGDVTSLSIWANNLEQRGREVVHGVIREVSLVLAGANPGAFIESVLAHGEPMEDFGEEGIFYSGEGIYLEHSFDLDDEEEEIYDEDYFLSHAAEEDDEEEVEEEEESEGGKTVKQVYDSFTPEQKQVVGIIAAQIAKSNRGGDDEEDEEEDDDMKHNIFDSEPSAPVISHDDMKGILENAKRLGSLRAAVEEDIQTGGVIAHALDTTGMTTAVGEQDYGFNDVDMVFPDYRSLNTPPEWISRNMDWVSKVMSGVHHTPFSRIKSMYANITEDEARAKGYIKGKQKKTEVFTTLKRTTDPATIYKLQKMDRDDIIDITDFDVVAWIKAEMRVMLNEECARAILIGDGRQTDAEDHIPEDHIRPIAKDVPLFNITVPVEVKSDATPDVVASETITAVLRARKQYKGSGNPTFFTTEDVLTEMLLLKDAIGHPLYKTEAELATALRVKDIVTVEVMEGQKISYESSDLDLIGVIVNLGDYNVGTNKGGQVELFDDFDLDFNKYEYLIETRFSGALVKPFSAMTVLRKNV